MFRQFIKLCEGWRRKFDAVPDESGSAAGCGKLMRIMLSGQALLDTVLIGQRARRDADCFAVLFRGVGKPGVEASD